MDQELKLVVTIDEESYQEALKKVEKLRPSKEGRHLYFLYGFLSGVIFTLVSLVLSSIK